MVGHCTLEGHLDRFRNRHRRLTGGKRQRNRSRICTKRHTLGHAGMRITADDDRPVIHRNIVQNLVDDIGHRVILVLWIAACDQPEIMHEFHQFRRVFSCLEIPDRGGVTARLIGTIDLRRNHRRGHRLEFLRGHQASCILRSDDIDAHPRIGAGMQHGTRRYTNSIGVEDFFNRCQPLSLHRNFL